ncbi:FecCD family ABC transporter permease [Helicobacter brantae]|uniref:Iron ABC transporter permease n=1 Tax=Helicobacter brantae TaxID=375927 RepID=A0A3D8J2F0_9HELI|nr:iron ABC transporter permease [Helicobacter brantae]RDU71430.1 iron ABC transporter permease [Helicobacter brantae]
MSVKSILQAHRQKERKKLYIMLGVGILMMISFLFDISTGPSMLPLSDVINVIASHFGSKAKIDPSVEIIVNDLRLPIALMALFVGSALGAGGAGIQTLLNNPMASPYTLGLAAASGLGASLVIAFGTFGLPLLFAVPLGAFVMTMIASFILFVFASFRNFGSSMLVLVGIALLFLFQSILSLIQYLSSPEVSQQILFWLFGSLQKSNWVNLCVVGGVTLVCTTILLSHSWQLTALKLGESRALSMGINLSRLRLKVLILISIMTATAISFVGVIGFIGLVAPHIARMVVGEDQRFFLLGSMIIGACFLSISSVLSKVIVMGALFPVGIVTSFVGVPFFFWIILSRRKLC